MMAANATITGPIACTRGRPPTPFDRLTVAQRRVFALVLVDRVSGHPDIEAGPFAERHGFREFVVRSSLSDLSRLFPGPLAGPPEPLTDRQRGALMAAAAVAGEGAAPTPARCAARLNVESEIFRDARSALAGRGLWPFPIGEDRGPAGVPTPRREPAPVPAIPEDAGPFTGDERAVLDAGRAIRERGGSAVTTRLATQLGWTVRRVIVSVDGLRKREGWPFDLEAIGGQHKAAEEERAAARDAEDPESASGAKRATPAYFARPTDRLDVKEACERMLCDWRKMRTNSRKMALKQG